MIELIISLIIIIVGFVAGRMAEKRHYAHIKEREAACQNIPAVTFETLPKGVEVKHTELAQGSVVVAVDAFKKFLAGFRMMFGGEMKSYSSLIDRARREAILRMHESAPAADFFLNVRLETSTIADKNPKSIGSVEILAYATAVYSDQSNVAHKLE